MRGATSSADRRLAVRSTRPAPAASRQRHRPRRPGPACEAEWLRAVLPLQLALQGGNNTATCGFAPWTKRTAEVVVQATLHVRANHPFSNSPARGLWFCALCRACVGRIAAHDE